MAVYQDHRPHRFKDVVGQDEIVQLLKAQVHRNMTGHSYLFVGPSGVGKTSMARILALAINCESPRAGEPCLKCRTCEASLRGNSWDTHEFDAATFRGIDAIRELTYNSRFAPFGKCKFLIIDECHQLTPPAWDALLRLLEEPAPSTKTILCTTEAAAVPVTARSRCQLFEFRPLGKTDILAKLTAVCRKERWAPSVESLRFIAGMADGNLRTAETFLEQAVNLNHLRPNITQVKRFFQGRLNT